MKSLRIRLASIRGSCVPMDLLTEVADLESEVAELRRHRELLLRDRDVLRQRVRDLEAAGDDLP